MNHADIKKHLAAYLEGELPIDDRALVDAHLDACDLCAGEVEEMLQTIRLLRTLPEPEIPPMITANVMRRIRSGESQLGFFGRIARALGAVFEPAFVLPASAIAAAALVVTVVQGLGVAPTTTPEDAARDPRNEGRTSIGRTESSVASMPSSIAATRRGERARASRGYGASGSSNGMDIVARVERRATQADQTLQIGRGQPRPPTAAGSGTRIRIRFEGLRLAEESTSESSTSLVPQASISFGGPILTSRVPQMWTTDLSKRTSGNALHAATPGRLVVAERSGAGDFMARSWVWPQTFTQGDYLTGTGSSTDSSTGSSGGLTSARASERDPRDAWLALGFEDPAEFARYIAGRNLAEQELWAGRLSERAEERGLLGEFLQALRDSGDPTAIWVADDFSAQAERARLGFSEAEEQPSR